MPETGAPAAAGEATGSTGETRIELKTPITDESSAAEAMAGLLDLGDGAPGADGAEHDESGRDSGETGAGESPPTGDEEGHSEPEGAIAPPNSWSDEHKALFKTLPPDAQKVIAQRESERESAFTKRTQEIAEERKGWEAERAAIATQRQQYLASLQQLVHLALPEAQAFAQITEDQWSRLAAENPAQWAALTQQRDSLRNRVQAVTAEIQRVQARAIAEHHARLVELEPDFADKAKGQKLAGELSAYLQQTYGFTPQEIGSLVDHRLVRVGLDAMRAKQQADARASAEQKRSNTAPAVQRAGTPQGSDATVQQRAKGLIERLGRTNDVRDAGALLEAFL